MLSNLEEYVMNVVSAETLYLQINIFLDELKKRSKVAVAVQAFTPLGKMKSLTIFIEPHLFSLLAFCD